MKDFQSGHRLLTASRFADWVFRRLKGSYRRVLLSPEPEAYEEQLLAFGQLDHEEIERIAQRLSNEMIGSPTDYGVSFSDSEDTIFEAPSLRIGDSPLRGRPDLVLEHKRKDHVIIVERKTSRIPRHFTTEETMVGNWVNIECQLWCYSYLTPWAQRKRVTLVGEIWRYHNGALVRALAPLVWEKVDTEHEARCTKLFQEYARQVERGWIR